MDTRSEFVPTHRLKGTGYELYKLPGVLNDGVYHDESGNKLVIPDHEGVEKIPTEAKGNRTETRKLYKTTKLAGQLEVLEKVLFHIVRPTDEEGRDISGEGYVNGIDIRTVLYHEELNSEQGVATDEIPAHITRQQGGVERVILNWIQQGYSYHM